MDESGRLRAVFRSFFLAVLLAFACGCGGGGSSSGGGGPGPGTAPGPATLLSAEPASGSTGVPVNSALVATFAEPVESAAVRVTSSTGAIPGSTTWGDNTVRFVPSADFSPQSTYTATVDLVVPGGAPSGGAKTCSWTFTTGPVPAVRGTLVPAAGLPPLEGAEVRSEDATVLAGTAGRFSFATMPPGKHLLVAEKSFPGGAVLRVLGVATVYAGGSPVKIDVPVGDFTDGYTFCYPCHPTMDNVTRSDQVYRCVPMPRSYPVPCETCHTLHREIGYGSFLKGDYALICNQCHGSG